MYIHLIGLISTEKNGGSSRDQDRQNATGCHIECERHMIKVICKRFCTEPIKEQKKRINSELNLA